MFFKKEANAWNSPHLLVAICHGPLPAVAIVRKPHAHVVCVLLGGRLRYLFVPDRKQLQLPRLFNSRSRCKFSVNR